MNSQLDGRMVELEKAMSAIIESGAGCRDGPLRNLWQLAALDSVDDALLATWREALPDEPNKLAALKLTSGQLKLVAAWLPGTHRLAALSIMNRTKRLSPVEVAMALNLMLDEYLPH